MTAKVVIPKRRTLPWEFPAHRLQLSPDKRQAHMEWHPQGKIIADYNKHIVKKVPEADCPITRLYSMALDYTVVVGEYV